MDENGRGDDQSRQSEAVADFLHDRARRTQGRRRDIRAAVAVDDTADSNVDGRHQRLADRDGPSVMARLTHLGHDGEEPGGAGEGEDERGHSRDGIRKFRVLDSDVVGDPGTRLRCISRAILDSNGDRNGKDCAEGLLAVRRDRHLEGRRTCSQNRHQTDPGEETDTPKGLDAAKTESQDGGHEDKDGRAGAVSRHGVQGDRDGEHTGACHEDPVWLFGQNEGDSRLPAVETLTQAKCRAEKFTTNPAEHDPTSIVDPVDFTMVQLEHTDHVVRPCGDNGNGD